MANEAPHRRKTTRSRTLLIAKVVAGVVVVVGLYPRIVNANVQWPSFVLVMTVAAVLGGAYLGVIRYKSKNPRD